MVEIMVVILLLTSMKISITYGANECSPSRCRNQYIGHPFTLKGDPSNCTGDENFRLSCIGNKTFMAAPYDKYLVTSIFYNNFTIDIVHMELASGKCSLPSQAITPTFFPHGFDLTVNDDYSIYYWWAGFINCSEKLDRNFRVGIIPCLSQNNRFIYIAENECIGNLPISCSYLTMVPINDFDVYKNEDDIFRIMKNGFSISWTGKIPRSEVIHYCLTQAVPKAKVHTDWSKYYDRLKFLFQIEFEFVHCVQINYDSVLFGCSIAFAVLIDVIFLYLGTIGYMAPELISRSFGLISYKSDVYSFGMLLLEMAGGRRNYDSRVENSSEAYYPSWIYDRLYKATDLEVLEHKFEPVDIEKKLCKVGLWCIQMSPSSRPTMLRVIEMLEGDVEDVEMPPKPFFFSTSDHITRVQNSFQMCSNEISTIYESE